MGALANVIVHVVDATVLFYVHNPKKQKPTARNSVVQERRLWQRRCCGLSDIVPESNQYRQNLTTFTDRFGLLM
jgi:hypothetical protein